MRSARAQATVAALAGALSAGLSGIGCDRASEPTAATGRGEAAEDGKDAGAAPGDAGARARAPDATEEPAAAITPERPSGAPRALAEGRDIDDDPEVDVAIRERGERLDPVPRDLDGDGEPDVRLSDGRELERGGGGLSIMHAVDGGAEQAEAGAEPEREPVAGEQEPEREAARGTRPPVRRPSSGMGTLACVEAVMADPTLGIDEVEARRLCTGGVGEGPAVCAAAAMEELLIDEFQAVELCQCARSLEPVRCYERGLAETTLTEFDIIRLCSPVWSGQLGAGCVPGGALVPPYP